MSKSDEFAADMALAEIMADYIVKSLKEEEENADNFVFD